MSKSDKELLELAAKAAGLDANWKDVITSRIGAFKTIKHEKRTAFICNGKEWNPLTDDNDALRLSIDLSMNIQHIKNTVKIELPSFGYTSISDYGDDKYAATRRAITLAAAAIGEAMP